MSFVTLSLCGTTLWLLQDGFAPDDPLSFKSAPAPGKSFALEDYPVRIMAFGDVDWTDGHPGDPPGNTIQPPMRANCPLVRR